MPSTASSTDASSDDAIDFGKLAARLRRGLGLTIGLALLGLALGLGYCLTIMTQQPVVTTLRVNFGFPGFERGNYPNGNKFQPDDLRAPDVINEAIKRLASEKLPPDLASKVRGAITISGVVSPNVVKERDRLRAAGQTPPPYVTDEYEITLSLPRNHALNTTQRELLLSEIVSVFMDKFRRTYVELPPEFGNAFQSLRDADFAEYELVLTKELQSLRSYLEQKIDTGRQADASGEQLARIYAAKQFRSPTNNLSFEDLLKQTDLFIQIRLNDVLSQVYTQGLSKDREYALVKMDYHLRNLEDREEQLRQEETVVTNLLAKTQERAQNYVLATKVQNPSSAQPILDQGFVDTLLANDAYNFLIRRALDAGLALKRVEAEKSRLAERKKRMESFTKSASTDQSVAIDHVQKALVDLEKGYQDLLGRVRTTLDDYSKQEFADAVRVTMQAKTTSLLISLVQASVLGVIIGLALGLGVSLIRSEAR